jgi:hypothetical protein
VQYELERGGIGPRSVPMSLERGRRSGRRGGRGCGRGRQEYVVGIFCVTGEISSETDDPMMWAEEECVKYTLQSGAPEQEGIDGVDDRPVRRPVVDVESVGSE